MLSFAHINLSMFDYFWFLDTSFKAYAPTSIEFYINAPGWLATINILQRSDLHHMFIEISIYDLIY